jgi:hypothetical protein
MEISSYHRIKCPLVRLMDSLKPNAELLLKAKDTRQTQEQRGNREATERRAIAL